MASPRRAWLFIFGAAFLCAGCKREEGITSYRAPKDSAPVMATAEMDVPTWAVPAGWRALELGDLETAHFAVNSENPPLGVSVIALPAAANALLPNLNRWERQLGLPASSAQEVDKSVRSTMVNGQAAQAIDLINSQAPARRMLAVIITHGDQKWFFKMSGPAEQVSEAAHDFAKFVASVHFGEAARVATSQAAALELVGYTTPEGWQIDPTTNTFRVVGFTIGAGDSEARVSVTRLGADRAGGLLDNLNRWRGQAGLAPIGDETAYQPTSVEVGDLTGELFDITAVQGQAHPSKRLLIVFAGDGQNIWFFKLSGAAATVGAQENNFRAFLSSVRFGALTKLMLKRILTTLASLKLAVVLMALAMVLIYAGTWAQVDTGVWRVQRDYFHSLFVWIDLQTLLPRPQPGHLGVPGGFPMLGGYSIGLLLLINLLAAHIIRFKFTPPLLGIILIHLGVILLLVGEGVSSQMQIEGQMTIEQGGSSNYMQDIRRAELAVVDASAADHDEVTVIPAGLLKPDSVVRDPRLPFAIRIDNYFANSEILGPMQPGANPLATAGSARRITAVGVAPVGGAGSDAARVDAPSAYVTPIDEGKPLGTYMVSLLYDRPQEVRVRDKTYLLQLRFKRYYQPYTLHLLKFTHDRYPGTDVPRNFASRVRLVDASRQEDREETIWMNHPLRYHGATIYQADFDHEHDRYTVLQVVENPGAWLPYLACLIGAAGLIVHFGLMLMVFLVKAGVRRGEPVSMGQRLVPWAAAGCCVVYLLSLVGPPRVEGGVDLTALGSLPVTYEGRVQPLDSVARNALRAVSGRQTLEIDGREAPAMRWLANLLAGADKSLDRQIVRIDSQDLISFLNLDGHREHFRYSLKEIFADRDRLIGQFDRVDQVPAQQRDAYQHAVADLKDKLTVCMEVSDAHHLLLLPPVTPQGAWTSPDDELKNNAGHQGAAFVYVDTILSAYFAGDSGAVNGQVADYRQMLQQRLPDTMRHVDFEAFYNHFDPFYQCMLLYLSAFLLLCVSWLAWRRPLARAAAGVMVVGFILHTLALVARVYISGRPPVINLASSALFIPWFGVGVCLVMEYLFRNSIAITNAAIEAAIMLFISWRLSLDGDNMKVLQAVLDTNFWLATHVVCVTLGYSATFLAGMFGIAYVVLGVFTPVLAEDRGKRLLRMIYGTVGFAMTFSFVGTVLGGIWADQSWGRFWGWDPKENGAVLIVLANALLLHARFGGMARGRGIAALAIFGNIVTSWSWFGTNMLGVGLHSYGFMPSALTWLLVFVVSQILLIGLACIPERLWVSFRSTRTSSVR